MTSLLELVEQETDDIELIPEILPVDARVAISGQVSEMIELFDRAVAIVPTKPVIANTEYVLLETFDASTLQVAHTQVSATDGERCIAALNDTLKISMFGSVLLPGKKVRDILKLAPQPTAQLVVLGNTATIRSGRAVWTIQTPVGDTLPPFPDTSEVVLHPVARQPFLKALEAVRKSVSTSTARQALTQARVAGGRVVSCDGARLHAQTVEDLPADLNLTIAYSLLDDAIRSLRAFEDDFFELGASNNTVVFRLGQDLLMGQRLLLEFPPNMDGLLLGPKMLNEESLILDQKELAAVVKRVRVTADVESNATYLAIRPTKVGKITTWHLTVTAKDKSRNSSQETMDIEYRGGTKAREICVNHQHLLELLDCLTSTQVEFKLGEKNAPMFIEDGGFTGVLNPMMLGLH